MNKTLRTSLKAIENIKAIANTSKTIQQSSGGIDHFANKWRCKETLQIWRPFGKSEFDERPLGRHDNILSAKCEQLSTVFHKRNTANDKHEVGTQCKFGFGTYQISAPDTSACLVFVSFYQRIVATKKRRSQQLVTLKGDHQIVATNATKQITTYTQKGT